MVQSKHKLTVQILSEKAEPTYAPQVANFNEVTNPGTGRIQGATDEGGTITEEDGGPGSVKDEISERKTVEGAAVASVRETSHDSSSNYNKPKNMKETEPEGTLTVQQLFSQKKKDKSRQSPDGARSQIYSERTSTPHESSQVPIRNCNKSKNKREKGPSRTHGIQQILPQMKKDIPKYLDSRRSAIHRERNSGTYASLRYCNKSKDTKEKDPVTVSRPSQKKTDVCKHCPDGTASEIYEEIISTTRVHLRSSHKSKNIKEESPDGTLTDQQPLTPVKQCLDGIRSEIYEEKTIPKMGSISKKSKSSHSPNSKPQLNLPNRKTTRRKMLSTLEGVQCVSPENSQYIACSPEIITRSTDLTEPEPPTGEEGTLYSHSLPPLPLYMQTHPDQHLLDRTCSRELFLRSTIFNRSLPNDKERISALEIFNLREYESGCNKKSLEHKLEKKNLPNCLWLSKMKEIAELEERPAIRDEKHVYQVKCFCPNAAGGRRASKIPIATNSSACPPKAKTAPACFCDVCGCSPCSDPNKRKPADTCDCKVNQGKPGGGLPPAKPADTCDCKDCQCEVCLYKPETYKKPKAAEGTPSNKDCCCKGECTCQTCPVEALKAAIRETDSKLSSGSKPEDCDCIECVCPNSTSRLGKAAVQKKDSQFSKESIFSEDCECDECVCPNSKSRMGKGRGDQPQNPPGCDCPICECPGAKPLDTIPEGPPSRKVECDCDDCQCSPCSDPKRKKSVPRGPTGLAFCDCPDCQCQPCADPTITKGKGDAGESCDCEVCVCADQIQTSEYGVGSTENKSTHPPDCICDECLCDTEKHEKGCVCPECRCADCYYKKEDKGIHADDCQCGDCKCVDCAKMGGAAAAGEVGQAEICNCPDCVCDACEFKRGGTGTGPGESQACNCDDCKCTDCARKPKDGDKAPAGAGDGGKQPAGDEPPPFEIPVRIACTCKNCSCADCNKEGGSAALPAGSVRPATAEAPPFRIPVRVPCRCLKCECEDCNKGGVEPSANKQCACPTCMCAEEFLGGKMVDSKGMQFVKDDADKGLQVGGQSGTDADDAECKCPDPCVCPDETDVSKLDDNELRKQIQSGKVENSECRQQITDIRKALDKLERICNGAGASPKINTSPNAQDTQNKPFVKQASDFAQTMSGLKLALLNLQHKCKAKDKMIDAMTDELKFRTSSNTLENLLDKSGVEEPVDYDKADDAQSPPRRSSRAPENEKELASTGVRRSRKGVEDTSKHKKKVCKCGRTHKTKGSSNKAVVNDVDLTGFEITDIHRVTEDSIIINWKPPKIDSIKGYNIFINDVNKSKVMSGARTTAMIHGLDLSATINISIYAVTKRGQCAPPAAAVYEIRH